MQKLFVNTPDEVLVEHISTMNAPSSDLQSKADKLDVIMKFWPYIKPVLSIAKIFTNSKIDALIDAVIQWGDEYTQEN